MTTPARIIFAGSPDFAVPPLQALLDSDHEVVAVYTQPDRPSGRGRKLVFGPVKQRAVDAGVPVYQPKTLRDPDAQAELAALDADLMVVVAYGLLLPSEVLTMPRCGCINLHASLLPRWRGAAPIQMAVLHGDAQSGVCLMQMDEGLDTGDVLASVALELEVRETAATLHDKLAAAGAELLRKNLDDVLAGELVATPQPEAGVTYAARIKKSDGAINWQDSAVEIDRQIRAYAGWPVAFTHYAGELLRCWEAQPAPGAANGAAEPGTIISAGKDGLQVQTGDGVLLLTRVQLAGRKPVSGADFANAFAVADVRLGH